MAKSAHVDDFCRRNLPPQELQPEVDLAGVPELAYPEQLNAASLLLGGAMQQGWGERTVFWFEAEPWTYRRLLETANRIAHVLIQDLRLVPGNRVLLRGPNNPMLAACWFAVLKAGGVVVNTMPLLRQRELDGIVEQAHPDFALCDSRFTADLEAAMSGGIL